MKISGKYTISHIKEFYDFLAEKGEPKKPLMAKELYNLLRPVGRGLDIGSDDCTSAKYMEEKGCEVSALDIAKMQSLKASI